MNSLPRKIIQRTTVGPQKRQGNPGGEYVTDRVAFSVALGRKMTWCRRKLRGNPKTGKWMKTLGPLGPREADNVASWYAFQRSPDWSDGVSDQPGGRVFVISYKRFVNCNGGNKVGGSRLSALLLDTHSYYWGSLSANLEPIWPIGMPHLVYLLLCMSVVVIRKKFRRLGPRLTGFVPRLKGRREFLIFQQARFHLLHPNYRSNGEPNSSNRLFWTLPHMALAVCVDFLSCRLPRCFFLPSLFWCPTCDFLRLDPTIWLFFYKLIHNNLLTSFLEANLWVGPHGFM